MQTAGASADELRVAAVQLSSQDVVAENLERVAALVARAAKAGAELVVLPENFAYMGSDAGKRQAAEPLSAPDAPIQRAIRALARRQGVTIVAGGFPEKSDDADRPFNTSLVIDTQGEIVAAYRKIHLFDVDLGSAGQIRESTSTTAGTETIVTSLKGFGVGLSICYDLRFPELYRALVDRGAEILTVPAAFTLHTGKDHWHPLLKARAIESQCYVVAAAQWGRHPEGRMTYGHALVADPWGTVIADASDGPGLAIGAVQRTFLNDVRAKIPCLTHRRDPRHWQA